MNSISATGMGGSAPRPRIGSGGEFASENPLSGDPSTPGRRERSEAALDNRWMLPDISPFPADEADAKLLLKGIVALPLLVNKYFDALAPDSATPHLQRILRHQITRLFEGLDNLPSNSIYCRPFVRDSEGSLTHETDYITKVLHDAHLLWKRVVTSDSTHTALRWRQPMNVLLRDIETLEPQIEIDFPLSQRFSRAMISPGILPILVVNLCALMVLACCVMGVLGPLLDVNPASVASVCAITGLPGFIFCGLIARQNVYLIERFGLWRVWLTDLSDLTSTIVDDTVFRATEGQQGVARDASSTGPLAMAVKAGTSQGIAGNSLTGKPRKHFMHSSTGVPEAAGSLTWRQSQRDRGASPVFQGLRVPGGGSISSMGGVLEGSTSTGHAPHDLSFGTGGTAVLGEAIMFDEHNFMQMPYSRSSARINGTAIHKALAIVGFNSEKQIILWNTAAQTISGFMASECLGRPMTDLLDFEEDFGSRLSEFTDGGPIEPFAVTLHAVGSRRVMQAVLSPIYSSRLLGFALILTPPDRESRRVVYGLSMLRQQQIVSLVENTQIAAEQRLESVRSLVSRVGLSRYITDIENFENEATWTTVNAFLAAATQKVTMKIDTIVATSKSAKGGGDYLADNPGKFQLGDSVSSLPSVSTPRLPLTGSTNSSGPATGGPNTQLLALGSGQSLNTNGLPWKSVDLDRGLRLLIVPEAAKAVEVCAQHCSIGKCKLFLEKISLYHHATLLRIRLQATKGAFDQAAVTTAAAPHIDRACGTLSFAGEGTILTIEFPCFEPNSVLGGSIGPQSRQKTMAKVEELANIQLACNVSVCLILTSHIDLHNISFILMQVPGVSLSSVPQSSVDELSVGDPDIVITEFSLATTIRSVLEKKKPFIVPLLDGKTAVSELRGLSHFLQRPVQSSDLCDTIVELSAAIHLRKEEERYRREEARLLSIHRNATWTKGRLLGNGATGTVYEAINDLTGGKMAVKMFHFSSTRDVEQVIKSMTEEIAIHSQLNHPNIVQYLYCEHRSETEMNLFMELCDDSLDGILNRRKRLALNEASDIARQVVAALCYLRTVNVIHRDIKPPNILMKGTMVKLTDFGTATILKKHERLHGDVQGTFQYMAPEVYRGLEYTANCDVWSVGCLVLTMIGLQPTFMQRHTELADLTAVDIPQLTKSADASEQFGLVRDFVFACLQVDPNNRPSIDVLALHPFLTGPTEFLVDVFFNRRVSQFPDAENSTAEDNDGKAQSIFSLCSDDDEEEEWEEEE
jgi:PAS domain S-box-containing protein